MFLSGYSLKALILICHEIIALNVFKEVVGRDEQKQTCNYHFRMSVYLKNKT